MPGSIEESQGGLERARTYFLFLILYCKALINTHKYLPMLIITKSNKCLHHAHLFPDVCYIQYFGDILEDILDFS